MSSNDVIEAIFEFCLLARDMGPQRGGACHPLRMEKLKKFFLNSDFLFINIEERMSFSLGNSILTKVFSFFIRFTVKFDHFKLNYD